MLVALHLGCRGGARSEAAPVPRPAPRAPTVARPAPPPRPVPEAPPAPAQRAASPRERLHATTPDGMSLVLITIDSLRWDLHYAGNPRAMSPNIDRLAARSVVFERGYALSSYTGRAIGPLMAGRYPTECPNDGGHFTWYADANVMLAERLRDAGFSTFGAASHSYFKPRFGLTQGMQRWDTSAHPSVGSDAAVTDHRVADAALRLFRERARADGRFFLWVHFIDPHTEYQPHREFRYGPTDRDRYDAEVRFTDAQVGRLLDAIDAHPAAARTVVALTADHGEMFREHGMVRHGIELWENLVRVPWLVRVPGVAPRRVAARRSQIDLAPTLLDLLRVPYREGELSGVSLAGDLVGEPSPERPIFLDLPEGPRNTPRRAVIHDGWKLLVRRHGRRELYHLDADPAEARDRASSEPARRARMEAVLRAIEAGLDEPGAGRRRATGRRGRARR